MIFRVAGRSCWFVAEVSWAVLDYLLRAAFAPPAAKRAARAAWLSRASRRHLRIFNYSATISGPIPQRGQLVSNHLSYLDILVIAPITPAVFVSKAEVRQWPLFGWLAALAGTVFVNRERRTQVGKTNFEIEMPIFIAIRNKSDAKKSMPIQNKTFTATSIKKYFFSLG